MTLLGAAYVKGYNMVKATSPEHLAHFYLIMTAIRMLAVLTMTGIYLMLFAESREDALRFAAATMLMYVVMMVATLSLKH